ncbi:MAG TPA: hypothetical protein VG602_09125 [Actinomycetota bacterium]|nr:hypothetical protein [Actinomycetota bacterium]
MPSPRGSKVAVLVAAFLWLEGSAQAGAFRHQDPNDTRSPLDIRLVTHGLHGGQLTWHVVTYGEWSREDLRKNWFAIPINVLSDDPDSTAKHFGTSWDYVASVTARRYRYIAEVWDHDKQDPVYVGPLDVRQAGSRKMILTFPESYLEAPGPYEWNLGSLYNGRRLCVKKRCDDWTVGKGFFDLGATQER